MGTLRAKGRDLGSSLKDDIGMGVSDATTAFKQTFGVVGDGGGPVFSLFAMPGVDLMNTTQVRAGRSQPAARWGSRHFCHTSNVLRRFLVTRHTLLVICHISHPLSHHLWQ